MRTLRIQTALAAVFLIGALTVAHAADDGDVTPKLRNLVRNPPHKLPGQVVLRDDTMLSLGVNSELMMKDYAFEPIEEEYSFAAEMVRGPLSHVSGVIAKLSPDFVKPETA